MEAAPFTYGIEADGTLEGGDMGKLTRSAGRLLGAGIVVLAGAGIVALAGAGVANARPASTSACDKITATFISLGEMTTQHPGAWGPVATAAAEFTQDATTGSPAVKSAVSTLVADLRADVASRHVLNRLKLGADTTAIDVACAAQATAPSGAPATGGGSTASAQDAALFGVGGTAVLAGLGVLGLARRRRPPGGESHG
jgi:hypothetical protein